MWKFFSSKSERNKTLSINELIAYANSSLSGTGTYAIKSMSRNWPQWANKMQDDLLMLETKGKEHANAKILILAGKGWENFSVWFRRTNDDKTTPLKKSIELFSEALNIEPDNNEAKIALASLIIERVQVRDLETGLEILNQIPIKNTEVRNLINKANRWSSNLEFNSDFEYTQLELIPLTSLREERKRCRALIRELKKQSTSSNQFEKVLNHMYRVAIIHDAATHVMLNYTEASHPRKYKLYFKRLKKLTEKISNYSYQKNGRLKESYNSFLSNNDYKSFELIFGDIEEELDPIALLEINS